MDSQRDSARRRVLVIDDNHEVADALGLLVEALGHEARVLYHGADAVGVAHEYRPDVVFLDLGMPGMDGFDVARALAQLPQRGEMTVIALTGYGDDDPGHSVQDAGFDRHLLKPAQADTLRAILNG